MPSRPDSKKRRGHPIFAAFYSMANRQAERTFLGRWRQELLADIQGDVLEVGAGTWTNLPYYPSGVRLVATEPDPYMRRRALEAQRRLDRSARLLDAVAEELPFPDESFDAVVSTLVFCSVEDPPKAAAEVFRVLRPGGRLHLIEHIRSTRRPVARIQDILTPVSRWCAGGCRLNRETREVLRKAGFVDIDLREVPMGPPVGMMIVGRMQKP